MSFMNRLGNVKNPYQGDFQKVLCVCSAGLLRSPTLAWVLSNPPYNFNTRACGVTKEFALIPYDEILEEWADVIVFADHEVIVNTHKPRVVLQIPDVYGYRDPKLVDEIIKKLAKVKWPIPLKN